MQQEQTILSNLVHNEEFLRKVLPFIQTEYFQNPTDQIVFDLIKNYVNTYNKQPTHDILLIDLGNKSGVSTESLKESKDLIKSLEPNPQHIKWLLDTTEKWCQEKAVYNAMIESLDIIKDPKEKRPKTAIPSLLENALAVSFESNIGHDYLEDADERFAFYHEHLARVPYDIDILNDITKGGQPRKTLGVLAGAVGFGKTAIMCHMAGANLVLGKNVLYITLEMSREMIAERIDANLLDISLEEMREIPKSTFDSRIAKLRAKNVGKLIIQEYPTGGASVANFRHLLYELKIKKSFIPDIIYIDYLNICASSRVKMSGSMGMYLYVKYIAEEIRGLAIENDIPIMSATQINREGFKNSDPGMEHTSESFGLPATVDFMWIIIVNDELLALNQIMIKQAKNRYSDPNKPRTFIVGRDLAHMRLYNVSASAQEDLLDNKIEKSRPKTVFDASKFANFK